MARLLSSSGYLALEINFRELDNNEWVQYDIAFLWNEISLIADAVLKRHIAYWNDRVNGAFRINESEKDTLIPVIEQVLATNKPDYWEPLEPDVTLAFYPGKFFPFIDETEIASVRSDNNTELNKCNSNTAIYEDLITVITMIDEYNFQGSKAFSGDGIALILTCKKQDLTDFLKQLKQEYSVL